MTRKKQTIELDSGQSYLTQTTNEHGEVCCVFSTLQKIKVGTGTTTRTHMSKLYWFVEQIDEKEFCVRRINRNHVPTGDEITIPLDVLLSEYTPELNFYEDQAIPAMQELEQHLEDGERFREEGMLYSAEHSFSHALAIEEKNIRALFNLGIIHLESHNIDKARDMMQEILEVKAAFKGKNQFLFNEFGIALRKSNLFAEAVEYYSKAAEFAPDDENLFFNIARANYERGHWVECAEALNHSRTINPTLKAAEDLHNIILTLHKHPLRCESMSKPPVPDEAIALLNAPLPSQVDAPADKEDEDTVQRARGDAISSNHFFDI